jgi:hypothetical protein
MKNRKFQYFWFYCFVLIFIILLCSYISALKESFLDNNINNIKYRNISNNYDIQYHLSEDEIRKQYKHKLNILYVKDPSGRYIGVNMEKTQNYPSYYEPGTFLYSSTAYVPTYEDAIQLSNVKERM